MCWNLHIWSTHLYLSHQFLPFPLPTHTHLGSLGVPSFQSHSDLITLQSCLKSLPDAQQNQNKLLHGDTRPLGNCLQPLSLPLPAPRLLADYMKSLFVPGTPHKPSGPGLCRLLSPPRREVSPLLLGATLYTSLKTQPSVCLSCETGRQHFCLRTLPGHLHVSPRVVATPLPYWRLDIVQGQGLPSIPTIT